MLNRYFRGYNKLIDYALSCDRNKGDGYFENHHIIPGSLGGSNSSENMVLLTAKEHFIAHYLLTKFTEDHHYLKMVKAFDAMGMVGKGQLGNRTFLSCHIFQKNRIEAAKAHSKSMKGRKQSPEVIAIRAAACTGKKRTAKTKALMSSKQKGLKNPAALVWEVYDSNDILVEVVYGAFLSRCKEQGWSQKEFRESAKTGRKVYDYSMSKQTIQRLVNNGMYKFKGWRVVKFNKKFYK